MNGKSPTISPIFLKHLEPIADSLDCSDELAGIHGIIERGASYQRQRAVFARTGSMREVVARWSPNSDAVPRSSSARREIAGRVACL